MTDASHKFEVAFDSNRQLLRWRMQGFWTMTDVAAFRKAMGAAVGPLGPPPHEYDGLCDSRDFQVQTGPVSAALGEIDRIGTAARRDRGRFAIVVGSVINKLQAERTLKGNGIRVFLTIDEAEAWLQDKASGPS
jgi:hypothetical protein